MTATNSASKMDPRQETVCLRRTGSPTDGKMIAPAPQGPWLGREA